MRNKLYWSKQEDPDSWDVEACLIIASFDLPPQVEVQTALRGDGTRRIVWLLDKEENHATDRDVAASLSDTVGEILRKKYRTEATPHPEDES